MGHYVTERGAANLTIDGKPAKLGQPVDAADWPTLPSLLRQGFLLFVPEEVDVPLKEAGGEPLWDGFPHRDDLFAADVRTVQQAHWLTDEQLEDLPGIGEAGVEKIRTALAMHRDEQDKARTLSDFLSDSELELIHISRGEQQIETIAPTDTATEGIRVPPALRTIVEALNKVGFLELHLTTDELIMLRLSREDFDPKEILEELKAEDGSYKLSEPLQRLLERLEIPYPPEPTPAPAKLAEPEPPPKHPTADPEPALSNSAVSNPEGSENPAGSPKATGFKKRSTAKK